MPKLPDLEALKEMVDKDISLRKTTSKENKKEFLDSLLIFSIVNKNSENINKEFIPSSISAMNYNYLNLDKKEREFLDKQSLKREFFDIYTVDNKKLIFNIFNESLKGYHKKDYDNLLEELLEAFRISYSEEGRVLSKYSLVYEIEDNEFYEVYFDLSKQDIYIDQVVKKTINYSL